MTHSKSPTPVRVLYLSAQAGLGRGGQRSLLQLVERLDPERFSPYVVTPEPGPLSRSLFLMGVPVYDCPWPRLSLRKPRPLLRAAMRLRSIVREVQPAIIHADSPRNAHLSSLVRGTAKLVMHLRVATPDGFSDRLLARNCDSLIAISQGVAARFQRYHKAGRKLQIIYNGFDFDQFKPLDPNTREELLAELNLPVDRTIFALLAGYVPFKGQRFLLDIWPQLANVTGKPLLLLAGDGPVEEKVYLQQRIEREGLGDSVRILPFIDQPERFLPILDAILLPSTEEGFGRVLVEAAACGVPAIASAIPGIDEAVSHGVTGLLVSPRDSSAWQQALTKLSEDSSFRHALGSAALNYVRERFSLNRHVQLIMNRYDYLLKGSND